MKRLYTVESNGSFIMEGTSTVIAETLGIPQNIIKKCSADQKDFLKGNKSYTFNVKEKTEETQKMTKIQCDWTSFMKSLKEGNNRGNQSNEEQKRGIPWYYHEINNKTTEDFKKEHKKIVKDLKKCHYL